VNGTNRSLAQNVMSLILCVAMVAFDIPASSVAYETNWPDIGEAGKARDGHSRQDVYVSSPSVSSQILLYTTRFMSST